MYNCRGWNRFLIIGIIKKYSNKEFNVLFASMTIDIAQCVTYSIIDTIILYDSDISFVVMEL